MKRSWPALVALAIAVAAWIYALTVYYSNH